MKYGENKQAPFDRAPWQPKKNTRISSQIIPQVAHAMAVGEWNTQCQEPIKFDGLPTMQ